MTECSVSESIWLLRIAGSFLGTILAFIYVNFAWYKRGSESDNLPKNIKVKGLCIFSVTTGVPALIGFKWQVIQPITSYMFAIGFAAVICLILFSSIIAYFTGKNSALDPKEAHRTGWKCAMQMFYCGWPSVQEISEKQTISIHNTSKINLLQLMHDANKLIREYEQIPRSKDYFSLGFKAIVGMVLYKFFQHNENEHPDYCATYYKLAGDQNSFEQVVRLKGGSHHHKTGKSCLGKESVAMLCLKEGQPILYPEQKTDFRIKKPNPKLRGARIKHFLVLPVPFDSALAFHQRKGVLCIDTAKRDAWQLGDKFHVDLLIWCTTICDQLHDSHL